MRTTFNDYTIDVQRIESDYGKGFSAIAYVAKNNGKKSNVRVFEIYEPNLKPGMVADKMKKILDI